MPDLERGLVLLLPNLPGQLGGNAGLVGAALWAFRHGNI